FAEVQQHFTGITRADLAGVSEPVALVIADEQGPDPDARALRVGPAGDDELLPPDAFDLHPGVTTSGDIETVQSLADDPLFGRLAGPFPGTDAVSRHRRGAANPVGPVDVFVKHLLASRKREAGHVEAVEIEDIERIEVGGVAFHPPPDLLGVVEVEPL